MFRSTFGFFLLQLISRIWRDKSPWRREKGSYQKVKWKKCVFTKLFITRWLRVIHFNYPTSNLQCFKNFNLTKLILMFEMCLLQMDTVATTSLQSAEQTSQRATVQLEENQNEIQPTKESVVRSDYQVEKSKRLQEKVDSIALYLFPCIFLLFNLIYWPYYLFYEQNRIWSMKLCWLGEWECQSQSLFGG